jgi:hypothetical protein
MELDEENCRLEPFSQYELVSAKEYLASLRIPGNFNWPRAIRTLLVHQGLSLLLPVTDWVGPKDRHTVDPLAVIGGSDLAFLMLKDSLSPVHMYAIGVH